MAARPDSTDTVDAPAAEPSPSVEAVDPEPGPPSRLTVQRGLFFGPSALVPEDLYAVVERGGARRERHRVVLDPHSAVATNTYFGRFHATYWQRWTAVGEVEVTAPGRRHRPGAADGVGREQGVAHRPPAEDVRDADGLTVRLVAADRPVRRRRRPVAGADHRVRAADRRGRGMDRRAAPPAAAHRCRDLHLQPRRRLPQHADRDGRRPGRARRRRVRGRRGPGQRPAGVAAALRHSGRAARRPPALPAPAQPRRRGRLHPGPVRGHRGRAGRRPRRPAHGRRRPARARDPGAAHRLRHRDRRTRPWSAARCSTCCTPRTCTSARSTPIPRRCGWGVRCPERCRSRTCSGTTTAICRRCRTSASTPSTTAGGRA